MQEDRYQNGYRPFIGWVCGICLAMYYIPYFILGNIIWVVEFFKTGTIDPYPVKSASLMELAAIVLGVAALRTYEKVNDIAKG